MYRAIQQLISGLFVQKWSTDGQPLNVLQHTVKFIEELYWGDTSKQLRQQAPDVAKEIKYFLHKKKILLQDNTTTPNCSKNQLRPNTLHVGLHPLEEIPLCLKFKTRWWLLLFEVFSYFHHVGRREIKWYPLQQKYAIIKTHVYTWIAVHTKTFNSEDHQLLHYTCQ